MIIVQVAGRLGKDAETRFTTSGQKVTTLTLATNIRKAGKEETVWWRVTIWGERYDKMLPYLKKGSAIIVVGEMNKPEIWNDKEGRPQVGLELTAEIIRFNPFGGSGQERPQEQGTTNYNASAQTNYGNVQGVYGNQQPIQGYSQSNYGNNTNDFGGSTISGGGASFSEEAEEPIPF
jgi:single-strand DNA-binding protein